MYSIWLTAADCIARQRSLRVVELIQPVLDEHTGDQRASHWHGNIVRGFNDNLTRTASGIGIPNASGATSPSPGDYMRSRICGTFSILVSLLSLGVPVTAQSQLSETMCGATELAAAQSALRTNQVKKAIHGLISANKKCPGNDALLVELGRAY